MVYRPNVEPNLAFVLIPFSDPFEEYYQNIIRPAAKAAGLATRKADEIYSTGPIIHDIWRQIWSAIVVIADVTGKNPNVNYELGICHTLGVPTVIITQSVDDVPFDYRHRRCILYDTHSSTWQRDLKRSITATLEQVLIGEDVGPELIWPYETSPLRGRQGAGLLVPANDARDLVVHGARLVRDAVSYSFGPNGAHVSAIVAHEQRRYYKKGVDIANNIRSLNPLEDPGVSQSRQVAMEMHTSVGDGSKTAIVLFYKMLELGTLALKRNHPRVDVLRGMERAVESVIAAIRSKAKGITGETVTQIARTAAGGNKAIGLLMTEAFRKAGKDGLIVVEQTNELEMSLDVQEGMQFDRGYIDAEFIRPGETEECVLHNAYILVYEYKISSMRDLVPLLEDVAKAGRPLLVIADDVEGEALATLVLNRKKGVLDCVAVRAPGYADRRKAVLQDIAMLTAAAPITVSSGRKLSGITLQDLGEARKVIVARQGTTIVGGKGEASAFDRVRSIREELSRTKVPYDVEKLRERLARLSGAVVIVRVGGNNFQEVSDNAYSVESAMHSVQKAIEEGAVPGGGLSLLHARTALDKLTFKRPGEKVGVRVVSDALEEPTRQLIVNSRANPEDILEKIRRAKDKAVGFNSETSEVQSLVSAGVLDPVATVTNSVRLAFSFARTLLETAAWDSTGPDFSPKQVDPAKSDTADQTEDTEV